MQVHALSDDAPQHTNGRLIMSEGDLEKLSRIDERTKFIQDEIHQVRTKLESDYVTKAEFNPVKLVVYGLVGLILVAVVGALTALVL